MTQEIKRVAILFAGGPAPAANSVIATAASSFMKEGIEVYGIKHGYSRLAEYTASGPMREGVDYIKFTHEMLAHARTSRGIMIGTARTNPGKHVSSPEHLDDAELSAPLRRVYEGLVSMGVDALISIGGDDTLKTANKIKMFQDRLPEDAKKFPVVHLPKTIDNDYMGIDFTFGYFTAVETLAEEIRNLNYDASAGRAYFICEAMGRSAGWLAYGAAIAGEASMVLSVEDIAGSLRGEEVINAETGETRPVMEIDRVIDRMVDMMLARERQGREYGVIVIAEGLAEFLPSKNLEGIDRDEHGHIAISQINLGAMISGLLTRRYEERTGKTRKVNGLQLGYECRCAPPHAFDVMLGSQLGVGAYRALKEEKLNGVMVSVSGQLDLHFVPFDNLVDPKTLVTKVRFIEGDSDFYKLARFLETCVED
ncbi:Pyrophosphate--fructose 6-phosphate 1-phosphotransferase [Rosistilla oblonga]|uniref:Pyrophosphate--fructose 6-phosphate 1-phosphotransferase n=1 Tax=Rosistilla oblonga TaxID=2527990 RepID=A0A518J0H3_9BACT|nr:6-phosphofructokinase [Rosistilla oblonga]QDV12988.1 Pyrophosphate--fructose 6-phosphate 1-phosphotransferase [Rosistilla oblonga]QDV58843.1 Pyrophosphate--fructose 6-phosphate 1-phosphotransferase [Rosistilla oblonga]